MEILVTIWFSYRSILSEYTKKTKRRVLTSRSLNDEDHKKYRQNCWREVDRTIPESLSAKKLIRTPGNQQHGKTSHGRPKDLPQEWTNIYTAIFHFTGCRRPLQRD